MPTYCYRDTEEKIHTRVFSMKGEIPKEIVVDGGLTATRDYSAEHGRQPSPGTWPMYSEAAGCHPDQVGEFRSAMAKAGVPTEFTPDGRAKFESRGHRAKALKVMGLHDRSGGYSD